MEYRITYITPRGTSGDLSFIGSFDEIRTEAREAVHSGECERVEVRDDTGALRYHYPRAAPSIGPAGWRDWQPSSRTVSA